MFEMNTGVGSIGFVLYNVNSNNQSFHNDKVASKGITSSNNNNSNNNCSNNDTNTLTKKLSITHVKQSQIAIDSGSIIEIEDGRIVDNDNSLNSIDQMINENNADENNNNNNDIMKRWSEICNVVVKAGLCKGLANPHGIPLYSDHWLEAIDVHHRCGSNLNMENFFTWLDCGSGSKIELPECSREQLERDRVTYCNENDCKRFEVVIEYGLLKYKQIEQFVHTQNVYVDSPLKNPTSPSKSLTPIVKKTKSSVVDMSKNKEISITQLIQNSASYKKTDCSYKTDSNGNRMKKFIFVLSCDYKLYVAQKTRGSFHHSSFLSGGAVLAAGRLTASNGKLLTIAPHSGHYRTGQEHFNRLLSHLGKEGLDMEGIKIEWYKMKPSKQNKNKSLPATVVQN
eukprot:Pgem_evm1s20143